MYKKSTVVLVPFPFTDLSGNKVRPAIIVSNNVKGGDVIVIFISSKKGKLHINDVLIATDKENGLKATSHCKCAKIATLDKKIILGELGVISAKTAEEINKKLKTVLGI